MLKLWLNKSMFWVSEQSTRQILFTEIDELLFTELDIEKLQRNVAENDCYKEEERNTDDTGNNLVIQRRCERYFDNTGNR